MPRIHAYCLPFQSEGNYAFVNTADSEINSNCFKPACGGKVAHFENDTATEPNPRIKTPLSNRNKIVKNDVLN